MYVCLGSPSLSQCTYIHVYIHTCMRNICMHALIQIYVFASFARQYSMHVRMYVYMYACMCVLWNRFACLIFEFTHAYMHYAYMYECMRIYTHTLTKSQTLAEHVINVFIYACMHICMHTCMHTYLDCPKSYTLAEHMFDVFIYACVHTCMYASMYAHTP